MGRTLNSLINDIKSLKIQGAKQIAVESLRFLKRTKLRNFNKVAKKLEAARPTAVVLHNCLEILRKKKDVKMIDRLLRQLKEATKKIAVNGSKLIKKNIGTRRTSCAYIKIMTHCHSGEALAVIKQAWKEGKKIGVYATETEPKHQGIKTAKELYKLGIPVVVIEDPANGYFMPEMDCVVVGSDALRREGFVNKIGTYPLALVAKKHKKPFYVVGNTFKLDRRKKLIIEERPAKEVYANLKELKGIKVRNPAFDLTPWKYVTRIVTERGVMTPGNLKRLLK